jgi:hypothetical protein
MKPGMGVGHDVEQQGRQCEIDDKAIEFRNCMWAQYFQLERKPA